MENKIWSNLWLRFLIIVGLAALFLLLCYELRQILIPLALAFIVAYIFDPVVDFLEKKRIPRTVTIAILLVLIIAVLAGSLLVVIPRLVQESVDFVESFQESFPAAQKELRSAIDRLTDPAMSERLQSYVAVFFEQIQAHVPQLLQSTQGLFKNIVAGTFGVVGAVVNFLLFAVVSVYLLKDFDRITAKGRELIPPARRESVLAIVEKTDVHLRSFFRGQIIVCTILALIYLVGLSIVGVPFAYLLALVGGYGQIVPYLGTALGVIPAVLLALIDHGDFLHPLAALFVFAVGQSMEGFFITPKIVGDKVGLHPVVIILAILVFGKLLGFLGILFAVPLAAVLKVMIEEVLTRYRQSALFTGTNK